MAGPRGGLVVGVLATLLAACAGPVSDGVMTTSAPNGAREQIPVAIEKPDGPGPFPAVVILHDCSGLGPRSSGAPARWAHELVAKGYVVAMPDSFARRGFPDGICTVPPSQRLQDVTPERRARDAQQVLEH